MLRRLRPRSAYDVMAAIAFFIAVAGGTAYAAATITGADVVDGSLTGADIKGDNGNSTTAATNGSITSADISGQPSNSALGQPNVNGTLTTYDVLDRTLRAGDIATGTLTANELGANSVSTSELKDGSVTNAKLAPGATKVIVRQSSIPATATGGGSFGDCQGGEHVTGGGVNTFGQDGGQPVVLQSSPDNGDTTTPPTSWAGEIANRAGAGTVGGTVFAICASP